MEKIKRLVEITKQIAALEEENSKLREELLKELPVGYSEEVDGYLVEKKIKKITPVNPEILKQAGISLERVTVNIPKIDPALVKRIIEQEKREDLLTQKEEIVVHRKKE